MRPGLFVSVAKKKVLVTRNLNERFVDSDRNSSSPADELITRWFGVTPVAPDERSVSRKKEQPDDVVDGKETITFRASLESEDRAGDVIRADGWELDNYRQNPVVLWAHRHDLLPIGKSIDVWVENEALFATIEFARTEFAQQIKDLFAGGFLRGVLPAGVLESFSLGEKVRLRASG